MGNPDTTPDVTPFYDTATNTFTYVVADPQTRHAAIIDPVLDYEAKAARLSRTGIEKVLAHVSAQGLTVDWILETHAHADHLTGAAVLKEALGAPVAIGAGIRQVQKTFATVYGLDESFTPDGSQFERLFSDGEHFNIGALPARIIATPGHTDDSITYLIGDAAFIGDTLFRPDYGCARCDFPGGDAGRLYDSVQKLYALPPETRLFLCHDYPAQGQEPQAQTSVQAQRDGNVMLRHDTPREEFILKRTARDAKLPAPALIIPALQVNIRAGALPPAEPNGGIYLKTPVDRF